MATIKRFEDLEIWKLSRELASNIYETLSKEPLNKDFALRDQMRRSSGSIMDNIAEGFERGGNKEFIQFLFISKGSAGELRSQLYRALDAHYITNDNFENLYNSSNKISSSIMNFINYLKTTDKKGSKFT